MTVYLVGSVAVVLAGIVQGCTGFGYAMILAPPLMAFVSPAVAVPVITGLAFANSTYLAYHCRRHIRRAIILPLLVGGIVGLPLGIYFLARMDESLMKVIVGTMMVVFAALLYIGWTRPIRKQGHALPFVGTMSGFLCGSTSLGGPPVIIFLAAQETEKDAFRANLVGYFFFLGIAAMATFGYSGLITREVALLLLVYVPGLALGSYLGARLGDGISEAAFRRVAIACAGGMGAILALTNIGAAL